MPEADSLVRRVRQARFDLGQHTYIHADSETQAAEMDNLLWTFRQGSFLPHALYGAGVDATLPIHIGWQSEPVACDVLINLSPTVPTFFSRCEHIAEIVDTDASVKQAGRGRFRFYREHGITPESHTLES